MPGLQMFVGCAAFFFVAACQQGNNEYTANMAEPDSCGASALQGLIGETADDQDFSARDGVRIIPPDSMITMDHRPDRLNVDLDENGTIARIWCG